MYSHRTLLSLAFWFACLRSIQSMGLNPLNGRDHPRADGEMNPPLGNGSQFTERKPSRSPEEILRFLVGQAAKFPTAASTSGRVSEQCKSDSDAYFLAYLKSEPWALQMYESSGRFPEGFFASSQIHSRGLFDECLHARYESNETAFDGQYCTAFFSEEDAKLSEINLGGGLGRDFWIKWYQFSQLLFNGPSMKEPKVRDTNPDSRYTASADYCIPSSCSAEDFRWAVAELVGNRTINGPKNGQPYRSVVTIGSEDYCFTKKKVETTPDFDGPDIAVIVTLSLIGLLVLTATIQEGVRQYLDKPIDPVRSSIFVRFLHCFSALNNGKKLLSTRTSSENLSCLNGIRVLSTTWVVGGHTYYDALLSNVYNKYMVFLDAEKWQYLGLFANVTVSVDTFFLMSGLLVAYLLMRELERNKGRFNPALFYVHRYLRLTPVYAIILGFMATLYAYLGAGPNWQNVKYVAYTCRMNWWTHFLYVNNYRVAPVPLDCMGETWYLACDMQMFIISPLFIYPLWRWWKIGLPAIVGCILALLSGLISIFVLWDLPMTTSITQSTNSTHDLNQDYYVQTWTRMPVFLLGILLGWALYSTKNRQIKMPKIVVVAGWAAATAVALAVIYGVYPFADFVTPMSDLTRVSYGALARFAWACSVAWLIFACIHGYGGYVNSFLSWKGFMPLGRLTYVVYLIHRSYLTLYFAHARKPYYYTFLDHIHFMLGTFAMVFMIAFIVSVTIEASFLNLEKLIFSPFQSRRTPTQEKETDNKTADTVQSNSPNGIEAGHDGHSNATMDSGNPDEAKTAF